jgi:hypothetical protein
MHTQTQDMTPQPLSPVLGRVESTIDAAAVGSLATQPAGVPKRSPLFVGAAVTILAAGITVAAWTQRPHARTESAPAVQPPIVVQPPAPAMTTVDPAPPPIVLPSALPPAKPPAPAPAPAPKKTTTKKHEVAAPSPAPKPEPKAEPKGAYDQF